MFKKYFLFFCFIDVYTINSQKGGFVTIFENILLLQMNKTNILLKRKTAGLPPAVLSTSLLNSHSNTLQRLLISLTNTRWNITASCLITFVMACMLI